MTARAQALRQVTDDACEAAMAKALQLYGARVLENISLSKLSDSRSKARILGRKLMEHGDARAYAMGKELVAISEVQADGPH